MHTIFRLFCLLALGALSNCSSMQSPPAAQRLAAREVPSPLLETAADCRRHFSNALQSASAQAGFGERIRMLTWNTQKSSGESWSPELAELAADSDLLLLQEAVFLPATLQQIDLPFLAAAQGFRAIDAVTGLLSASRARPIAACSFLDREPLFRTRKASTVLLFPLHGRGETLLVANVHSINYSLSLGSWRAQLERLTRVAASHRGPIILAGDFNTWSAAREGTLREMSRALGLREVRFRPDNRKEVFGRALDRIFWRGLKLEDAWTLDIPPSDHDAMLAVWSLQEH